MLKNTIISSYIARHDYDLSHYRPDFSLQRRAVIIETRPLANLAWSIRNVAFHTGWPITVFCSHQNESVIDSLGFPVEKQRIDDMRLPNYTYTMVDARFWSMVPETVLIFQTDAFLLRGGIDEFSGYDYVGAPWAWAHESQDLARFRIAGNGGFSLRKKSKMLEIIREFPYERIFSNPVFRLKPGTGPPEDMYFAFGLGEIGGCVPQLEDQKRFCVETMFYPAPLAIHGIEHHFDDAVIKKILFPAMQVDS